MRKSPSMRRGFEHGKIFSLKRELQLDWKIYDEKKSFVCEGSSIMRKGLEHRKGRSIMRGDFIWKR